MNPMALMKLMSAKNKFNANHPKVGAFFKAAFGSGLQEGTILELTVTKPDGEKMTTNLKVKPSDLELLNELRNISNKSGEFKKVYTLFSVYPYFGHIFLLKYNYKFYRSFSLRENMK